MYGGNNTEEVEGVGFRGLSPYVRGKRHELIQYLGNPGSIPVCTGETRDYQLEAVNAWVYPRMYGGNFFCNEIQEQPGGLSPYVRGKHYIPTRSILCCRSIPVCTGETKAWLGETCLGMVYPRMYGGNYHTAFASVRLKGLSPYVRGKLRVTTLLFLDQRSIPVCTGET